MSDALPPLSRLRQARGSTRLLLFAGVAVVVVGIWLVARWASAPTYVTLYRDLELNEAGAVADKLGKSDIQYRLGAGGSEILVPVADLARARVALAKEGLPTSGRPGLELFDKPSWGMTDFTQRVTYQRALEGELARTIGGLQGVQRAQVHLVLPAPSPIRRQERPAGASVVLALKPGTTLSSDAIQGITYIVSNSVEGLSSDNVAVMDDAGHVLSVPAAAGSETGLTTRQLEIQRALEAHLSDKLETLLATVVGAGRSRAEVAAEMSFDQVDRTVETYDPDGQVVETEQRSETDGGTGGTGTQTVVHNDYQNSKKVEKNVQAVGKVTKLTVAVLVDSKALPPPGGAGRGADLDRIEAMVRNAIGVDSTRGDRVSVMTVPFENPNVAGSPGAAGAPQPKGDPIQVVERLSRPLVGVIAIAVLALLAFQLMKALGGARREATTEPGVEPFAEPTTPTRPELVARHRLGSSELLERPDAAAQVLRHWLAESS